MSPPLAVAGREYCRGALAHGLGSQRRQPAGLGVDAKGGQTAGRGTSSEEETAVRIECKGARNRFGRRMAGGCDMSGNGIHCKLGNAVTAAIADIEALTLWGQLDWRAGGPGG